MIDSYLNDGVARLPRVLADVEGEVVRGPAVLPGRGEAPPRRLHGVAREGHLHAPRAPVAHLQADVARQEVALEKSDHCTLMPKK